MADTDTRTRTRGVDSVRRWHAATLPPFRRVFAPSPARRAYALPPFVSAVGVRAQWTSMLMNPMVLMMGVTLLIMV